MLSGKIKRFRDAGPTKGCKEGPLDFFRRQRRADSEVVGHCQAVVMFREVGEREGIENLVREGWNDRRFRQVFNCPLQTILAILSTSTSSRVCPAYLELQPVQAPQALNKQSVLLWQVTFPGKLRSHVSCSPTVLQDVVDQRLFMVDVQRRGRDMLHERPQIRIRLGRINLRHCHSASSARILIL